MAKATPSPGAVAAKEQLREASQRIATLKAERQALQEVRGAYAVAILCADEPEKLIAAKQGSPLVVGQGKGEYFVASDIPAMLSHTREMIFLEDGEMVVFTAAAMQITTLAGAPVVKAAKTITWSPVMAEKGGYRHFMLKEIHEQPRAIADTLAGRLLEEHSEVFLEDLENIISDVESY